jgi:hypothetical protein
MSLATRLSVFFLAALAIALCGFSIARFAAILAMSPAVGHIHASINDRNGRHWRLAVRRIQSGSKSFFFPDRHEHGDGQLAGLKPGAATPANDGQSSLLKARVFGSLISPGRALPSFHFSPRFGPRRL